MTQLYARIKKSSQYFNQNQTEIINGKTIIVPFEVDIIITDNFGCSRGYHVQGGIGGQYTLKDVNLYVIEGDKELKIA